MNQDNRTTNRAAEKTTSRTCAVNRGERCALHGITDSRETKLEEHAQEERTHVSAAPDERQQSLVRDINAALSRIECRRLRPCTNWN